MPEIFPAATKATVSVHLRRAHGYEIGYAVAMSERILLAEHLRIHEVLEELDHVHEGA